MIYTITGSQGFIGNSLALWLKSRGHQVYTPERFISPARLVTSLKGHVVYCIGLTADFRTRPWETIEAHVCLLRQLLMYGDFLSFTYLSSTRVYLGSQSGNEDSELIVHPHSPDQLYNLSKLMGEAICHAANTEGRPIRSVRLSNVVGRDLESDNLVYALLRESLSTGVINFTSSPDTKKDYIDIIDVVSMLERIACCGRSPCYNLASGSQISTGEIANIISRHTGAKQIIPDYPPVTPFPQIDISRLKQEFNFSPTSPLDRLIELIKENRIK